MSLQLVSSPFNVVNLSLDGSRKIFKIIIESVNDDFEDTTDTNDVSRIGCIWLNLVTQVANDDKAVDEQYWYQCHQKFSEEEINSMPSWLINAKKNY